jgi:ribonuclease HI
LDSAWRGQGKAGGAAVWILCGVVKERLILPLGDGQVAEDEMEGILRATERALTTGADHVLIVSDSQAALKGVISTRARAGQHRTIEYDRLVRSAAARLPQLRITNLWTPAHVRTYGNELADDAAKVATTRPPPPSTPISLTTCRRAIDLVILEQWEQAWKMATTGRALHNIDRSPPSTILRPPYDSSLTRGAISIISQLRTNFSSLNTHKFRCRLTDSPACDACGAAHETRAHFLLHCPSWEPFRPALQRASYAAGIFGAFANCRFLVTRPP